MNTRESYPREVEAILEFALVEDIGRGDVTTESTVSEDAVLSGEVCAKASGVISGIWLAGEVFRKLDPVCEWEEFVCDGDRVFPSDVLARVTGRSRAILSAERTALNILQKMSGISTLTSLFVEATADSSAKIKDTRKTLPGLRWISKYAVAAGGGYNHRTGLYDGVLIKDNHIRAAGGIEVAVGKVRASVGEDFPIEVETKTMEQVEEAVSCGVDVIMLDNMDVQKIGEAVRLISRRALVEASGGVTIENVGEIARSGVDFISVGAITHSAPCLDISFDLL
ncbi:MAG: carboxylating nicotinate-nucleotide diphosphorylase [Candidatus Dadabacteria bacterium]|nr:carboxylating nicotinate-nucleotide diphosphorylase [Candidatus Dadabacteria bacterium]